MLFKTNTKGYKYTSIRLFFIEQDTIGKPKETKSGIQPRNRAPPPPPPPPKKKKKTKQKTTNNKKTVL